MISFFQDYLDPRCLVIELHLADIAGCTRDAEGIARAVRTLPIERQPFEIQPPSATPDQRTAATIGLRQRWESSGRALSDQGFNLLRPIHFPSTRKAHELVLLADEQGRAPEVHAQLLFEHHTRGVDIGRIDLLVEIAANCGLAADYIKVSLDVDRLTARVLDLRSLAERSGVRGVPTLLDSAGRPVGTTIDDLRRALEIDL